MKIVLFSSYYPGAVNKLNISRLVTTYPNYEYTYVLVNNRFSYLKNKFKNLIKEIVLFCIFQDISWYRARRMGEKKISMQVPANFDSHIKKIYVKDINSFDTEEVIRNLKPDILIQCGAGILKENIFSIPKIGTLNVHHGIAPELRGISSTFWALYYGLLEFIGTTVHFVDKTLDSGTVIIQKKTILPEKYDYVEAVFQTSIQGGVLLPEAVRIVQNEYVIVEKEVKSFYFSSVNYQKYSELRRNNFRPVGNIDALKYKMKCKKVLVPKLSIG